MRLLKRMIKGVACAATAGALAFGTVSGAFVFDQTVEAANYSSNKGKVTIAKDGTVTVDFTLSEVDNTQVLYGFGICLFEEKPDLLSNDKLVNSGNTFYDSDICKHVYHKELAEPVSQGSYNNTYKITYEPTTQDIVGFTNEGNPITRSGGMSLAEALQTGKDWYVVVGVHTTFGGVWHTNCDLYLGQISEVAGGEYFIPHEHSWKYEAVEDKIYAWCDGNCDYYATDRTGAVLVDTLKAEDVVYSGQPYDKAKVDDNIHDVTGATQTALTYYRTDNSGQTTGGDKLNNPPTDAGNYYVSYSITDNGKTYTAVKRFEIKRIDISSGNCKDDLGNPDSTPSTITVTIDSVERILTVGTDCELNFADGSVTITGHGNYTGSITVNKTSSSQTSDEKTDYDENNINTGNSNGNISEDNEEAGSDVEYDEETNEEADEDESDDIDVEDEDDDTLKKTDGQAEDSVTVTGASIQSGSPVTGYGSLVNIMITMMIMGMAGIVGSAYKLNKKEEN